MIDILNITKQYGSKVLFEDATLHISERCRAGLIGPNGSGKTTLFRLILGIENSDSGNISCPRSLAIGYLSQEVPKSSDRTVLAEVMKMDGRRENLLLAKRELETRFSKINSEDISPDLDRYGRIQEELEHLDEYRIEARAKEILMGIGFKTSDFDRSLSEFSGGWLMRAALAKLLLMDPDLLLLDEPTNHLDLESLLWLEEFLNSFGGAIVTISHDTEFLNRTVNKVFEIDQRQIVTYKGNIDAYRLQKEERLKILRAQYTGQQAKIAEMERFIARFRAKATKARQAQSRIKALEKIERIELPEDHSTVRFRFPPAPHSGKEVVTLTDLSAGYAAKTVFKNLNWTIKRGSRHLIAGVNGAGKTTLLKLLSGQLDPQIGSLRFGHEVKIGYYAQHQTDALDLKKTVLEELQSVSGDLPITRIRTIAGAFLFSGDAVEKRCSILSGGEKARVVMAKLLLSPVNFLLLDEPTNHLDIESRNVLLDALTDYEGTLCIVSHDRAFVSPLVDTILEIVPPPDERENEAAQVVQLLENYDDYLQRKIAETSSMIRNGTVSNQTSEIKTTAPKRSGPSNNQKKAWQQERINIETRISRLEKRQFELQAVLSDSKIYEDKQKSLILIEEQRAIQKDLNLQLSRWEELSLLLEQK
ncbi:MAG: hypothetical protein A3K03_08645 [Bdellovibrionales bacterium RIFOXYD1_FULL_44_7]|nr:MAG: hypothetical protein A3K03_08645 [Bdellovibrionales bacterium RIFOXYD1_FULL_44_7]